MEGLLAALPLDRIPRPVLIGGAAALGLLVLGLLVVAVWPEGEKENPLAELCPPELRVHVVERPHGERRELRCLADEAGTTGVALLLDSANRLRGRVDLAGGLWNGRYEERDAKGRTRSEGEYLSGRRSGWWTFFDETGERLRRERYEGDERRELETWYADGTLRLRASFRGDVPSGPHEAWYPDGTEKLRTAFDKGLEHGQRQAWFADGLLREHAGYRDGKLHGERALFHPNGEVRETCGWRDGQRDGECTFHHPSGRVRAEGRYVGGERQGRFSYYDEAGRLVRTIDFSGVLATAHDTLPAAAAAKAADAGARAAGERIFGGRPLAWWQAHLSKLRLKSDDDATRAYALGKRRAEANGLMVEEQGPLVKVRLGAGGGAP